MKENASFTPIRGRKVNLGKFIVFLRLTFQKGKITKTQGQDIISALKIHVLTKTNQDRCLVFSFL